MWFRQKFSKWEITTALLVLAVLVCFGPIPLGPTEKSFHERLDRELSKGTDDAIVKKVLDRDFDSFSWSPEHRTYSAIICRTFTGVITRGDMTIKVVMDENGKVADIIIRTVYTAF